MDINDERRVSGVEFRVTAVYGFWVIGELVQGSGIKIKVPLTSFTTIPTVGDAWRVKCDLVKE